MTRMVRARIWCQQCNSHGPWFRVAEDRATEQITARHANHTRERHPPEASESR
jgi:hypothetical protein